MSPGRPSACGCWSTCTKVIAAMLTLRWRSWSDTWRRQTMNDRIEFGSTSMDQMQREQKTSESFRTLPIPADHLIETAPGGALSEKQRAAVELMLLGKSLTATAHAVGVSSRTLYTWRQDEHFRDEL